MHWTDKYECRVLEGQHGFGMRRLSVKRVDGGDGIPWDDLQMLKDEHLGFGAVAVEVYPAAWHLVDEMNCRHLWEVPVDFPINMCGKR